MRHVYYLVVDCPVSEDDVSSALGSLAQALLVQASGATRGISLGQLVPRDDGIGLRPRLVLEEVEGA